MPNRLQRFFARLKSQFNDVAFGTAGSFAQGGSGRSYWLPGTTLNWDELTSDLWECPSVQACLTYVQRNFCQAPSQVTTAKADGAREVVPNHPLAALLSRPNGEYDGSVLTSAWLLSWFTKGDAYAAIERVHRRGLPSELWYLPHFLVTPRRDKQGVLFYEYRVRGQRLRIEREDIVHIRCGMNPRRPLEGFAPLASAPRDVYTLQQGSTYGAKAMRNSGIMGGLVTPEVDKDGIYDFDPKEFVEKQREKNTGDRGGEMTAWNRPLKYQAINATPADMAMDTMLDRPESVICALFGLPPQVVGLHVGRLSKTYANMREAREAAWEECLIPTQDAFGMQIGAQLLPQMSLNAEGELLGYDRSQIRPLQPDKDALHKRAREDFKANLIDRAQWKLAVGLKSEPGDVGVYYRDLVVKEQEAMDKESDDEDKKGRGPGG